MHSNISKIENENRGPEYPYLTLVFIIAIIYPESILLEV